MVTQKDHVEIYMDVNNITKLTSTQSSIESSKHHKPEILQSKDLMINKGKDKLNLLNMTTHEWKSVNNLAVCLIK